MHQRGGRLTVLGHLNLTRFRHFECQLIAGLRRIGHVFDDNPIFRSIEQLMRVFRQVIAIYMGGVTSGQTEGKTSGIKFISLQDLKDKLLTQTQRSLSEDIALTVMTIVAFGNGSVVGKKLLVIEINGKQ